MALQKIPGRAIQLASQSHGDIMYFNGTDWVNLPAGTSGQQLQTGGAGANPSWAAGDQLIQTKYDSSTRRHAVATGTNSQVYQTDTLPTIALGDQFMNVNITPTSTSNLLIVEHVGMYSDSSIYGPLIALFAGNYCIGVSKHASDQQANNDVYPQTIKSTFLVSESGWTSGVLAITARATGSGTITFNGRAGNRLYNTAQKSSLVVTEYTP